MTTELDIAKQKRKAARATYTKTVNKLQELLADESSDVVILEICLDQLTEKFKDLKTSDELFLNLLQNKAGITNAEYEKEYEVAQEYYEKMSTLKIKVKKAIASAEKGNESSASPNPTWRSVDSVLGAAKAKQNLPEIQLPQFDGDPRNWLTFWTQFNKIHEDVRIDVRDKFQYLLQSMKPDSTAKQIVESFPATEANYYKAIEYLEERFGKESVLIQIYVRELLKLVISDKTKIDFITLYDKLQTQIRALESLGLTQDKYAFLLFPLVESALPTDLIKIWERQKNVHAETATKYLLN